MRVFNQALLARQAWRLVIRPKSLCARLLKAKYYRSGSLLDTVFPVNSSPVWKGIEYGLELLKKGVIWRIGNGQMVKIWRDPWIPRAVGSRKPLSPRGNCRLTRVAQLLRVDGSWNEELLNRHMIPADVAEILKIRVSPRLAEDFVAWNLEKTGIFTVRSAYHLGVDEKQIGRAHV